MIFYYIRHGDPVYRPDSLTPLGTRQAEALAKRLALYGVDKIYSSTSNRALMTARPTCELLKMEPELLEFAHEGHAWNDFTIEKEDGTGKTWLFQNNKAIHAFCSQEIRNLGDRWYEYDAFQKYHYENGVDRIYHELDVFLKKWDTSTLDTRVNIRSIIPMIKELLCLHIKASVWRF